MMFSFYILLGVFHLVLLIVTLKCTIVEQKGCSRLIVYTQETLRQTIRKQGPQPADLTSRLNIFLKLCVFLCRYFPIMPQRRKNRRYFLDMGLCSLDNLCRTIFPVAKKLSYNISRCILRLRYTPIAKSATNLS